MVCERISKWFYEKKPDAYYRHVEKIPFGQFASRGIDHWIFDRDQTLDDKAVAAIAAACKEGHIKGYVLLSNCLNDGRKERLISFSQEIEKVAPALKGVVALMSFSEVKPGPTGYERSIELLGCDPSRVAMTGDQILTDILGANRMGLFSVLVDNCTSYAIHNIKVPFNLVWKRLLLRLSYTI